MDRKVIQQDRCFNARCHAMQSFRPCTYVCNTFEHVGGNMLECFNLSSTFKQMVFLKLVHTEYQVNHKTQPFWVKVVYLVPNVQTLPGHAVGTIRLAPTTTLHFETVLKTKYSFPYWIFYFLIK